jgi:uncharacterized membrane protein
MTSRMGAALLSLLGLLLSAYLYLYKIGRIGTLACGSGECETVQTSQYSRFLGVEVALIGLVGYALLLGVALVALQPAYATSRGPVRLLALLAGGGVLFTGYLTYLELFVLHAICRWCVGSAAIILSIMLLAGLELRRVGRTPSPARTRGSI